MSILIMDNGEQLYTLQLDAKTYTLYQNTEMPNHFNIVRYCSFTDTTSVITLPKKFLVAAVEIICRSRHTPKSETLE